MPKKNIYLLSFILTLSCTYVPAPAHASSLTDEQSGTPSRAYSAKNLQQKHFDEIRNLQQLNFTKIESLSQLYSDTRRVVPLLGSKIAQQSATLDGRYVLESQFVSPNHPANGAINNVFGAPTWVVPRENALAILELLQSAAILGPQADQTNGYTQKANLAADYLVRVQGADGGWYDQYSYENPVTLSKSPTQTAEVMIAFQKLGFAQGRYTSMKNGAIFLMSLQNPANKGGSDDGLISGGKDSNGNFVTWRWTSDNSFAYWALIAASQWASNAQDNAFAQTTRQAADKILKGINDYLYVSNPSDPDNGVWRRVIDQNHNVIDPAFHEWINYAPQMLDLPARGVGSKKVGDWIHRVLQKSDGSVVWNDGSERNRKSPGFSFQAALVWQDLGQTQFAKSALNWANNSGLWQLTPDSNGVTGGWIDWIENGTPAPSWQRFIDTSFYATSALNGGYDFTVR